MGEGQSNGFGGGGTGIYGQGPNGAGGRVGPPAPAPGPVGWPDSEGTGGSSGGSGSKTFAQAGRAVYAPLPAYDASGGQFGGGGGNYYKKGGPGVVRIVWGANREFPTTDVGPSPEV